MTKTNFVVVSDDLRGATRIRAPHQPFKWPADLVAAADALQAGKTLFVYDDAGGNELLVSQANKDIRRLYQLFRKQGRRLLRGHTHRTYRNQPGWVIWLDRLPDM